MPREVTDLRAFVAELNHDSRLALFAHCVALTLTVNAVRLPCDRRPQAIATADRQAEAVSLDMAGYWPPTAQSYLGRVTKARMLESVRERVSDEAAEQLADMKKFEMAEAAEQLLVPTDWLPSLVGAAKPAAEQGRYSDRRRTAILIKRLPSEFQPGPRERPRLIAAARLSGARPTHLAAKLHLAQALP